MRPPVKFTFDQPNGFDTIFCLEDYPRVKFKFDRNMRFGQPDEDQMVPLTFKIVVEPGSVEDDIDYDFNDQVTRLLLHILEEADNKAYEALAADELTYPLTSDIKPVILHSME